jgi:4-hydroxy-3-polyprenylbenzoate decarboxylase
MRIVLGITGASGAIFGVEFLKRCPAEEKYVILSRWGRNLLKSEAGVSPEDLAPFAKKVYSTDDMSSPLASGSNPFDAMVVLPCSVATLGKIANGISDTLLTRVAEVALKERRKLILGVRETPLSTIALENAHKLSRDGVIIMPVSPPFYMAPKTIEEMVISFANKVIGTLGLPVSAGWRSADLE